MLLADDRQHCDQTRDALSHIFARLNYRIFQFCCVHTFSKFPSYRSRLIIILVLVSHNVE